MWPLLLNHQLTETRELIQLTRITLKISTPHKPLLFFIYWWKASLTLHFTIRLFKEIPGLYMCFTVFFRWFISRFTFWRVEGEVLSSKRQNRKKCENRLLKSLAYIKMFWKNLLTNNQLFVVILNNIHTKSSYTNTFIFSLLVSFQWLKRGPRQMAGFLIKLSA